MSKRSTKEDAPAGSPKLVAKLAEVFSAKEHLDEAVASMRTWFNARAPGEEFGLRLLDCSFWAGQLHVLLIQAQIIAKGEEVD